MRLLLVEDDDDVALQLAEGLRETYSVDQAATGSEARYLAQINDYDLLVLDIGLPDVNGIDLCVQIRPFERKLIQAVMGVGYKIGPAEL